MTSLKHSYTRKCGPLKNVAFKVLTDVFHWTSFGGHILTSGKLRLGSKQDQERTNINDVKRTWIGRPWDLTCSLKMYVYRKLYKITEIEKIMWEQSKQLDKTLHWRRVRVGRKNNVHRTPGRKRTSWKRPYWPKVRRTLSVMLKTTHYGLPLSSGYNT